MNMQFIKDSLELLILLIIRKSDQYGYSLIQLIKKKVEISEGT
ncbi:PadR family transcriptional regulator, partial [Staphylococcus hominis]